MQRKGYIVACIATLGLVSVAVWAYHKIRTVDARNGFVSDEWLSNQESDRKGFVD